MNSLNERVVYAFEDSLHILRGEIQEMHDDNDRRQKIIDGAISAADSSGTVRNVVVYAADLLCFLGATLLTANVLKESELGQIAPWVGMVSSVGIHRLLKKPVVVAQQIGELRDRKSVV